MSSVKEVLLQAEKKENLNYLKNYLEGYGQNVDLPGSRKFSEKQEYIPRSEEIGLESHIYEKIKWISKKCKVDTDTFFKAVWGILLQYYNNTDDIVIVFKSHAEEGIKPLRVKSTENSKFLSILKDIEGSFLKVENVDYQDFRDIMTSAGLDDSILNSILIFKIPELLRDTQTASTDEFLSEYNFKINITYSYDSVIVLQAEYNLNYIEPYYASMILKHIRNVLLQVTNNPDILLSDIEIITLEERNLLLKQFNNTVRDYHKNKRIHRLIEEQAEKTPDKAAILFEDKALSYRELNSKSNSLADILRSKGVCSDKIVGIMAERSPEMLIGILAALKAGGAYLPLDPNFPEDRIAYMLSDSKAGLLLTQTRLNGKIVFDGEVIDLNSDKNYNGCTSNFDDTDNSSNLAYVIYTSGSTGKPKGTMIEHRSVLNFVQGVTDIISFDSDKTILTLTTMSFDIFVLETLLPLMNGLTIALANEKQHKDSGLLAEFITDKKVKMLQATPSRIKMLLQSEEFRSCMDCLEDIMVGGEPVTELLVNDIKKLTHARIFNMYGPTETTVWSTIDELTDSKDITIGRPISNTGIYILNKNNKLLPVGVIGEMYIAGDGIARGYLNREALTAERFIDNPFENGKKMYKTGDLARMLPDGRIEFFGRNDFQVKIRGCRIELPEIESRLLNHEKIEKAIVVARENNLGIHYLCAYFVAESRIEITELRNYLGIHLPDYMIPSYFIQLDEIPLTPNEKVDRGRLPLPVLKVDSGSEYAMPETENEKILVKFWQEVLELKKIGINDNFFILGGDSIKVMQLIALLRKNNYVLEYEDLFNYPIISELSKYLKQLEKQINQSSQESHKYNSHGSIYYQGITQEELQKIQSSLNDYVVEKVYPLSPMQSMMLGYHINNRKSETYFEQFSYKITGEVDLEALEKSVNILLERIEALRTVFVSDTISKSVQVVVKSDRFKIYYEDISDLLNDQQNGYIDNFKLNSRKHVFDLTREIPFRVSVFKRGEKSCLMVLDFHHITVDGWSYYILVNELFEIYHSLRSSKSEETGSPCQYDNYVRWLDSQDERGARAAWADYLKGYKEAAGLKRDAYGTGEFYQKIKIFNIDESISTSLMDITKSNGITLNTLFEAVWGILLQKYNNSVDAVFGCWVSVRPPMIDGIDRAIGLYLNMIPIRVKTNAESSFLDIAKELQRSLVTLEKYNFIALNEIYEEVGCSKELIDHFIVYENFPVKKIEIDGLDLIVEECVENFEQDHFNFSIVVYPSQKLIVQLNYNPYVYSDSLMETIEQNIKSILWQIASNKGLIKVSSIKE